MIVVGDGYLDVVSPPAAELFGVDEAKSHINNLGDSSKDGDVLSALVAARQHIENVLKRSLCTQTFDWILPGFADDFGLYWVSGARYPYAPDCNGFEIPRPPLISVDALYYRDADGAEQSISSSNFRVIAPRGPLASCGRLFASGSYTWPATIAEPDAVRLRFTAGYGGPEQVPEPIRQAAKLLLGDFFENREAQFVGVSVQDNPTVMRLLDPYIVR